MTLESWLASHPYLQPLADFHAQIDSTVGTFSNADAPSIAWDRYLHDFHSGIPLLRSSNVSINLEPAERLLKLLIDRLALESGKIAEECRTLQSELQNKPNASSQAIEWLLGRNEFESNCPELLRYLGWTALSNHLQPLVVAFSKWRDDEKWLRSYCPTCGAWAAMAQLLGAEHGRRRLLCCGRCKTRWQYRRTGCPFCTIDDGHRLRVLTMEGEAGLRVDYCEGCRGYLKTYDGEGSERVLLANWTSIHLDIFARDRELNTFAEAIYQF